MGETVPSKKTLNSHAQNESLFVRNYLEKHLRLSPVSVGRAPLHFIFTTTAGGSVLDLIDKISPKTQVLAKCVGNLNSATDSVKSLCRVSSDQIH